VEIRGAVADVCIDAQGRIYAGVRLDADGTFHIACGAGIEIWKRDGTKIGSWDEKGEAPGQFVAGSVHGAWMDSDGSLYTAEASRNNRLQKFVRV
jgi:hypothetical protein